MRFCNSPQGIGLVALLGMFFALLPPSSYADTTRKESAPSREHLYILTFNAWGELQNPTERDFAREDLARNEEIERIVIVSYGWANDGQASYDSYRLMVDQMLANLPEGSRRKNLAIIGVGWDSAQTGFRKLFTDILPLPGIGEALAWLPDKAFFPISFWSKAAQADRIGFGGLRTALNEIFAVYEGRPDRPDIILLGHSFGARIVSALMTESEQSGYQLVPFEAADYISAAILLQPALVVRNLEPDVDYPVMVTMSRHDRAIGFLYPIANVPLNAYGFTTFEAIVQQRLINPIELRVEATETAVTSAIPTGPILPERRSDNQNGAADERKEANSQTVSRRGWRTLSEIAALPLSFAFTLVVTPVDYVYIQGRGLLTHPVDHVLDTLAQIPLVEIPVDGLAKITRREIPWGRRSKGFLTLGPLHEGLGRMATPTLFEEQNIPVYSLKEIYELEAAPEGIFMVDASDIIKQGAFGLNLNDPWIDYTLGWLDPIGAHADYRNAEVMKLIDWLGRSLDSRPQWPEEFGS